MALQHQAVRRVILPQDLPASRQQGPYVVAVFVIGKAHGHAAPAAAFFIRGAHKLRHPSPGVIAPAQHAALRVIDFLLLAAPAAHGVILILHHRAGAVPYPHQTVLRVIGIGNGVHHAVRAFFRLVFAEPPFLYQVPGFVILILEQLVADPAVLFLHGLSALRKPSRKVVGIQLPDALPVILPGVHGLPADGLHQVPVPVIHIPDLHASVRCRHLGQVAHDVIFIGVPFPAVRLRVILLRQAHL